MKASLSIAVMALLGHISATELTTVPTAEALVQTGAHHHHKRHVSKNKKTKEDEIHGYKSAADDRSPYDPDVADAPEDMPRVGNDHEELHNAKLSPEGYYTGWFHKDYQGNYAQRKHKKSKKNHGRKHPRFIQINNEAHFNHEHDTDDVVEEFSDDTNVQGRFDHEKDTDDVVEEFSDMVDEQQSRGSAVQKLSQISNQEKLAEYMDHDLVEAENVQINFNHDNDSEDIPEGQDPLELVERKKGEPFKTVGELLQERAQTNFDNKVEEIQQIQQEQIQEDKEEEQRRNQMELSQKKAESDELVQIDYERIPHERDTDDVLTDGQDFQYNQRHSKAWNDEVNKKAMEIENEIKIEENVKLSQKKAEEDAKRKAQEEKVRKAEEKRKRLEQEQREKALKKDQENKRTIDLGQLYGGIDNFEAVQLDAEYDRHSRFMQGLIDNTEKMVDAEAEQKEQDEADDKKYGFSATKEERKKIDLDKIEENNDVQLSSGKEYERYHQQWLDEVDKAADKLEKQMKDIEEEKAEKEYKSPFKTINHQELYDGINLQTKNQFHTDEFNERVEAYENAIDKELKQDEENEIAAASKNNDQIQRVLAQGMTPTNMPASRKEQEVHHPNPSINLSEMYGTMYHGDESFLQLKFDHEHDNDDIVPELTENVVIEKKAVEQDSRKTDFAGDKYTEVYDD